MHEKPQVGPTAGARRRASLVVAAALAAAFTAACSDPAPTAITPTPTPDAVMPEAPTGQAAATAAAARTIYGLDDQNTLVVFDASAPGTVLRRIPLTGVSGTLVGVDFRPNDSNLADGDQSGLLYAVSGAGGVYTLDLGSGAATLRSTLSVAPAGANFGLGFNPAADRLRVHGEGGQNLRVNVESGATVVDTPLAYAPGDVNAGRTPGVVATAYTNSVAPAPASTELYAIDAAHDVLVRLDAPNDGRLTTVGRLVVDNGALVGFDVPGRAADRTGYATFTPPRFTRSFLYRVNLDDASRHPVAPVGHDRPIISLAVDDRAAADPTPASLALEKIGSFSGGGEGAAEITAYDPTSRRLFVVNGALGTVDVLDLTTPSAPTRVSSISVSQFGAGANSVAVRDGIVALAIEGTVRTGPGTVAFYRASTLEPISSVAVGALPDMITFTPSGRYVLTANEGEPGAGYAVDPEGSVSIVDVSNITAPTARTAGFAAYNGRADELRASGVRIFGPNASVAQDLEPEYVAVSDDSRTAYVTLQENNALATVNVETATVTGIAPFGYKDHTRTGSGLDASDRDSPTVASAPFINIRTWPVLGMYQPDAIAAYTVNGQRYLVTANEGDARDYPGATGLQEEVRVGTLTLNPATFTDAACGGGPCVAPARLGRLTVTSQTGRNAGTGQFDALYVFGARSFSIWTAAGQLVYDSGDEFEQRTTALPNALFNASNSGNALDDRSDNKGPEPEGVVLATFGAKTFAFVGLERVGGVIVYDVSSPSSPFFVTYVNSRAGAAGDLGPEGLAFVRAAESPNGKPLLIVGNEISGTTAIFQINLQ